MLLWMRCIRPLSWEDGHEEEELEEVQLTQEPRQMGDARYELTTRERLQDSREVPARYGPIEVDEKSETRAKWMDWKTVAAWIDTEGYLYSSKRARKKVSLNY